MKKKLVGMLIMSAMLLSGCGMSYDVVVKEDGTYTQDGKLYMSDADYVLMEALLASSDAGGTDEINAMIGKDKATGTEERNGSSYYVFDLEDLAEESGGMADTALPEGYDPSGMNLTTGGFYIDNAEADPSVSMEEIPEYMEYFVDMKITFPEEITETNLALSEDGKTVYINEKDMMNLKKLYAFSDEALSNDIKSPKAFFDGKKLKKNKYKGGVIVTFADDATGIKNAKLDGKNVTSGKTVKKKGAHKLVLEDYAGNKTTVRFTIK